MTSITGMAQAIREHLPVIKETCKTSTTINLFYKITKVVKEAGQPEKEVEIGPPSNMVIGPSRMNDGPWTKRYLPTLVNPT